MKSRCISLLFTLYLVNLSAQNGQIEGYITQADSLLPLQGIHVYLDKTSLGTLSQGQGSYLIKDVPPGTYTLITSAIGFRSHRDTITIAPGQTIRQDIFLEETIGSLREVVVMTKGLTGLKDIPGSVHYISPKEIQKFSYTDINRTLRAVPGINMQEEDGFGLRPNIGLRGTGVERSSKITIMEDGVLMAPAPYADPAAYYFPTIGRMQAVEILKGSSQIKYGPFTTGGAINMLSTQIPDQLSARLHLTGGSFGGRNLHAFAANAHRNVAYLAETFQYSSDGFKTLDGGGNTGFDKKDYLVKLRVNTNPETKTYQSLSIKAGQVTEVSHETYLGLTESDFAATPARRYAASQKDIMQTRQNQLSLSHFIRISPDFQITTTAYRTDFSRNWYKLDRVKNNTGSTLSIGSILDNPQNAGDAYEILTGAASGDDALTVRANNRTYYAQGIQSNIHYTLQTPGIKHLLDLGWRLHKDEIDRFQWDDLYAMEDGVMKLTKKGVPGTESNRIGHADAFAAFFQYQLRIGKFTATPGLRFEDISLYQNDFGKNDPERSGTNIVHRSNAVNVWIPGVGLDYRFNRYLSVFTGIHKGFSPPGVQDETRPEASLNTEAGIRFTRNALSGEVIAFVNDYTNLLGADLAAAGGGGTGDLFNGGEVVAKGIEFQASYDLLVGAAKSSFSIPVSLVYTLTDAIFRDSFQSTFEEWGTVADGDEFPYLSNHQVTLMLGLEHRIFDVRLSGRYIGAMRTQPGQGEIPLQQRIDSHVVIDASASFALHPHISLFGNILNVTNELYAVARRPAGLRPGMPVAFNVGLKANL